MLKDLAYSDTVKPASYFARTVTRARNYSNLVVWLLYSAAKVRPLTVIGAILMAGFHFTCQVAGIYAIYWFARVMEAGGNVSVPHLGISFAARSEPRLLWAVLAFSTLCFLGSASFQFFSRRLIFGLEERRYAKSLEALVLNTARLPDPRAPTASRILLDYGFRGLSIGCRFALVTAIFFFNAVSSGVGGLGAVLVLFRLDAPLTLLILLATLLGTALLYPLTLRASRLARDREKIQSAHQREIRRRADFRARGNSSGLKTVEDAARAQLSMWRMNAEQIFAIDIGKTLILGLVGLYLAKQIMAGHESWAILVAYLGALRLSLVGCAQAIRAYASVSRYYPQLNRYYLFVRDVQKIDAAPLGVVTPGETLTLGTLPDGSEICARAGERIALLTADSFREIRFSLLHAHAGHSVAPLGAEFLDEPDAPVGDAPFVLADAGLLAGKGGDQGARQQAFTDKVLLAIYRDAVGIGVLDEKQLLTCEDGEFQCFATLGTPAAAAAIAGFVQRAIAESDRKILAGESEDEEEEIEDDL